MSVDDISWADNYAWASDCAYKNGKYYFCFPAGTGLKDSVNPENITKWMGIGIAVSDSPIGPFTDLIGVPLWKKHYANDPCFFVDDDKAYIYISGYRVYELADDMKSVTGHFYKMDMGGYEPKMEDPWTYQGVIMEQENEANNHHSIVEIKGQWILFYHRWIDTGDDCENRKRQRKCCAEYLFFNEDGTIKKVERTDKGVAVK